MTLPLEDELEVLQDDLHRARRELDSLERAPYEGRVANPRSYERALHFARLKVRDLEIEYRVALAELQAQDEEHAA